MKHLYQPQPERKIINLLSPHDVGFITALAQDVTVTEKNIAAIESGFLVLQTVIGWKVNCKSSSHWIKSTIYAP
ncbi:hypothetical protein QYZ42_04410 [Vibrio parahaemolyticus]|nr:hypothetical protein [Vibrio parahaemolyticus]